MTALTDAQKALIDKKVFAVVTTLNRDGSPEHPGLGGSRRCHLRFNTARGRLKEHNLRRDCRLFVTMVDPDDPYRSVPVIRGRAETTEEGADAHIDQLACKYLGRDRYPWRSPGERRVTVKVIAERVTGLG